MTSSEHKGIYYKNEPGRQKRWCARLMVNGKKYNIGTFFTEKEAIDAYTKFIDENKNILTDRAKNITKNRPDFERNANGMIERKCKICGKISEFEKVPTSGMCKSCGIKKSFETRPAVGYIEIADMDKVLQEYESGDSMAQIAERRGVSVSCIQNKMKKLAYDRRNNQEVAKLINKKYGCIYKAQAKINELCQTGEFQKRISARLQGIPIEKWTGFVTPENKRFYASPEYKEWRTLVFDRDEYVCQKCGATDCRIEAHHIETKAKYPELKLDLNNGITLCYQCHQLTKGREQDFEEEFLAIIKNKAQPL